MAIDAKISHVAPTDDGGFELWLNERDPRGAPPGQTRLTIEGPVINRPCEGWELWGGDTMIMLGDVKIYDRISLTRLRECSTTAEAISLYRRAHPPMPELPSCGHESPVFACGPCSDALMKLLAKLKGRS